MIKKSEVAMSSILLVLLGLGTLFCVYHIGLTNGKIECSDLEIQRNEIGIRYLEIHGEPKTIAEDRKFEYIFYNK